MKLIRAFVAALACMFAVTAFAAETITPPLPNPKPAPISTLKTDTTVFQSKGTTFTRIGL